MVKMNVVVLVIPILLLSITCVVLCNGDNTLVVKTKSGPILGYRDSYNGTSLNVFKGVPYAQPPLGDR